MTALKEARRALQAGSQAGHESSNQDDSSGVILELACMLEAAVGLLRSTDLMSAPDDNAAHSLHAVVQHLSNAAELARRGHCAPIRPAASHPEVRVSGPAR